MRDVQAGEIHLRVQWCNEEQERFSDTSVSALAVEVPLPYPFVCFSRLYHAALCRVVGSSAWRIGGGGLDCFLVLGSFLDGQGMGTCQILL